jgi:hypothetical protein
MRQVEKDIEKIKRKSIGMEMEVEEKKFMISDYIIISSSSKWK